MTNQEKRKTARIIQDALIRDLGDDVEVVFEYGSQVKGTTHRFSDVDMSYVPVDESTWKSVTVLVGDILYDLYPIHWSTLETMAEWMDWRGSILSHCETTFTKSADAAERFRRLTERYQSLMLPDAQPAMVAKAVGLFEGIGWEQYQLARAADAANIVDARHHSQRILDRVFHCLVVLNQSSADTRRLDEIGTLERIPAGFVEGVNAVLSAPNAGEILRRITKLLDGVRSLLLEEQAAELTSRRTVAEVLGPGYPELKADLQKILVCCERRDKLGVTGKLASLVHELTYHLAVGLDGIDYGSFNSPSDYRFSFESFDIPRLLRLAAEGSFADLAAGCIDLDRRMREVLTEHGASLYEFSSVEELREHLEGMGS